MSRITLWVYRDHFLGTDVWGSALIAPVMMICIYFGIPSPPARKKDSSAPSFVGSCTECRIALMLAALQQGQRLDWWRSGIFNALFWSGAFFTLCALVRRLLGPNPLVALPYLWRWNTVLLGSLLFWFRFTLTLTIILIPQSLAIHGFEADQIGPAIIWSAIPLLPVALMGVFYCVAGWTLAGLRCRADMHSLSAVFCANTPVRGLQKTIIAPSC